MEILAARHGSGRSVINTVTEVASNEVNNRLTPGGAVYLTGTKIKIDGDNPAVNITLSNEATNEVTTIAKTHLAVNDPKKITLVFRLCWPKEIINR